MKVRKIIKKVVEIDGLPEMIAQAKIASGKNVENVCKEAGFTRVYWYRLIKGEEEAIAYKTIRSLEKILNTDFGIKFEEEEDCE